MQCNITMLNDLCHAVYYNIKYTWKKEYWHLFQSYGNSYLLSLNFSEKSEIPT